MSEELENAEGVEAQSWLSKAVGVDINLKNNPITGAIATKAEAEAIIQVVKQLDTESLWRSDKGGSRGHYPGREAVGYGNAETGDRCGAGGTGKAQVRFRRGNFPAVSESSEAVITSAFQADIASSSLVSRILE